MSRFEEFEASLGLTVQVAGDEDAEQVRALVREKLKAALAEITNRSREDTGIVRVDVGTLWRYE